MKNFLLPEDLRAEILTYLHDRPFKEVAVGVAKLNGLAEAPAVPAPKLAAAPDPKAG